MMGLFSTVRWGLFGHHSMHLTHLSLFAMGTESRAIGRYLALKHSKTSLYPSEDIKALALAEQAASVELCDFNYVYEGLAFQKVFGP